jgi:signal transduction histidine kinase
MRTLGTELRYLDVICFVFVLNHSTEALVLRYHSINEVSLAKIEAQIGQAMHGLRVSRELFPIYNDLAKRRQVLFLPDMVSLMMTLFPHRPRSVIEQIVRLVGMPPSAPLIYLPLAAEEQLIGILAMVGPGLQENDAPAFSAFAGQVAIAIENARLFEEVSVSREQLRQLAKQVVSAQEDERQRVSRELHDEAGQALTALKISLQLIQNDLPAEFGGLRERLNEATSLVDSTLQEIRLLAQALRPPSLDALHNINPTLEVFCREFRRRTQLAINYVGAELPALSEEANVCLYRFLQEALTNVAKHGRARRIWVVLQRDGDDVRLSVEDDGIGLQPGREMGSVALLGIGMLGMQERLELLGGRLEVDSQPGEGTRVTAHLPNVLKELDTKEVA